MLRDIFISGLAIFMGIVFMCGWYNAHRILKDMRWRRQSYDASDVMICRFFGAAGICCIVGGAALLLYTLHRFGVMEIKLTPGIRNILVRALFVLPGIVFLIIGKVYKVSSISVSDTDLEVKGTIVGYEKANSKYDIPGYKSLVVEYRDPYIETIRQYTLEHGVWIRKYPMGSKYVLSYSIEHRAAYDAKSETERKKMYIVFYIAGVVWIVLAIFSPNLF